MPVTTWQGQGPSSPRLIVRLRYEAYRSRLLQMIEQSNRLFFHTMGLSSQACRSISRYPKLGSRQNWYLTWFPSDDLRYQPPLRRMKTPWKKPQIKRPALSSSRDQVCYMSVARFVASRNCVLSCLPSIALPAIGL